MLSLMKQSLSKLLGIQEMVKVKACATNTSVIGGHCNHVYERVVNAKGWHRFRRFHSSERMVNPTMRISCSSSMQRAQGTLRGRGTRDTSSRQKKKKQTFELQLDKQSAWQCEHTATWPFQPRKHEAGITTTQPVYLREQGVTLATLGLCDI